MMNRTDGYRLIAVAELGRCFPRWLPASAIADRRGIPPAYLSNLVGELARSGVVRARRGPGGGLSLSSPPETIPLNRVVSFPEPEIRPGDPVGRVEAAVAAAVDGVLGSLTVADLVSWEGADAPEYSI